MTSIISYAEAEYLAARQTNAMSAGEPTYARSVDRYAWIAMLRPMYSRSSGVVTLVSDYGLNLPHIGSSSFVVDRRPAKHVITAVSREVSTGFQKVVALSVVDQMRELLAALSLNKSQLAKILRVTRPTIYDWFQGKEPNAANAGRLHTLLRVLARASVSGAAPLNARFVRQPMELQEPPLLELLGEEEIDETQAVRALEKARAAADVATKRRTSREKRLRALGFEDPTVEQGKEQLARNVALRDWPKR